MTLQDYLRAIRANWLVIVVATIAGIGTALVLIFVQTPMYRSTAQVFVAASTGVGSASDLVEAADYAQSRLPSYAELVTSDLVLGPVITELDLDETVQDLSDRVAATTSPETVVLSISVTDTSAERAADIAAAVARQFQEVATDLEPSGEDSSSVVSFTIIKQATPASSPFSPNRRLYVVVGLLLGFAIGFSLAIGRQIAAMRAARDVPPPADIASPPAELTRPTTEASAPAGGQAEDSRAPLP